MKNILALLAVTLMLFSCTNVQKQNFTSNAYKTLDSLSTLYNSTYTTLEELDKLGYLDESDKPLVKDIMTKAHYTIGLAGKTLKSYIKEQNDVYKTEFEKHVNTFHTLIKEVNKILDKE